MSKSIIEVTTKTKSNKLKNNVSLQKRISKSRKRKQTKRNNRKTKYIGGEHDEAKREEAKREEAKISAELKEMRNKAEIEIKLAWIKRFINKYLYIINDKGPDGKQLGYEKIQITENGKKNVNALFTSLNRCFIPSERAKLRDIMLRSKTKLDYIRLLIANVVNNVNVKSDLLQSSFDATAYYPDDQANTKIVNKIYYDTNMDSLNEKKIFEEPTSFNEETPKQAITPTPDAPKQPNKELTAEQKELLEKLHTNSKKQMEEIEKRRKKKN